MKAIYRLYVLCSILSLDVAIGACAVATILAQYLNLQIGYYNLIVLGCSTWIIYTADHLLDVRKAKSNVCTERHQFHLLYFNALVKLLVIACFFLMILLYNLTWQTITVGLVFIILILFFRWMVKFKPILKEACIAVGFALGISIALIDYGLVINLDFFFAFLNLGLSAFINLLCFSYYDIEKDIKMNFNSFTTIKGKLITKRFMFFILGVQTVLTIFSFNFFSVWLLMLSFAYNLLITESLQKKFKNENHRLLGDGLWLTAFIVVYLKRYFLL